MALAIDQGATDVELLEQTIGENDGGALHGFGSPGALLFLDASGRGAGDLFTRIAHSSQAGTKGSAGRAQALAGLAVTLEEGIVTLRGPLPELHGVQHETRLLEALAGLVQSPDKPPSCLYE